MIEESTATSAAPSDEPHADAATLTQWEVKDMRREFRNRLRPALERVEAFEEILTNTRARMDALAQEVANVTAMLTATMRAIALDRALAEHPELIPVQRALLRDAYEGGGCPEDPAGYLEKRLAAITGASPVDASPAVDRARQLRDRLAKGQW